MKTLLKKKQKKPNKPANVRLPKLEILKFAAEATKWQTFSDSYETAVNSSSNLNNIEMFNYLRCYHEGEALNTIVGLALTNKNYNTALARFTEKSIWQSATNNLSSKE